jgi:hypothetical protein
VCVLPDRALGRRHISDASPRSSLQPGAISPWTRPTTALIPTYCLDLCGTPDGPLVLISAHTHPSSQSSFLCSLLLITISTVQHPISTHRNRTRQPICKRDSLDNVIPIYITRGDRSALQNYSANARRTSSSIHHGAQYQATLPLGFR